MPNNHFWQFRNTAETGTDEAELLLYGEIASEESWWSDVVTPKQFVRELKGLGDVKSILVRIFSPGGDVWAASAIYSNLRECGAKIRVRIDGLAASAATMIAMAGEEITIDPTGTFMIHNPSVGMRGYYGSGELDELKNRLSQIKSQIVEAYHQRTKIPVDELNTMMDATTWMTGREAVEKGFCTNLVLAGDDTVVTNSVRNCLAAAVSDAPKALKNYHNVPAMVLENVGTVMDKTKEKEEDVTMADQITTVDALRVAYPNLVEQIENAAVMGERNRLRMIDEALEGEDLTGVEEVVRNAKYGEKPMNADALAAQMWKAQKEARKNGSAQNKGAQDYLTARAKDAQESGVNGVPSAAAPVDNKAANKKEQDEHDDAVIAAALGLETK